MSRLLTFAVEIWVCQCFEAERIEAPDAAAAEAIAVRRWQRHELDQVECSQTIISTPTERTDHD